MFDKVLNMYIPIFTGYARYLPNMCTISNNIIGHANHFAEVLNIPFKLAELKIPSDKLNVEPEVLRRKLVDDKNSEEYYIMKNNFKLVTLYSSMGLVFTNIGIKILTSSIGFIYPVYLSIKGMNNKDTRNWLVYWLVYSSLLYTESICSIFLDIIPMYHFMKLCLLVTMLKSESMTNWMYTSTLLTIHKHCENNIDDIIHTTRNNIDQMQDNLDNLNAKISKKTVSTKIS